MFGSMCGGLSPILLGRADTVPPFAQEKGDCFPGSRSEAGATKPRALQSANVTEDATLSDFRSSAESVGGDAGSDDADETEPTPEPDGTGLSTYAWGSYTCTRCESDTERVWRDEGAFVCPDCKSW